MNESTFNTLNSESCELVLTSRVNMNNTDSVLTPWYWKNIHHINMGPVEHFKVLLKIRINLINPSVKP